MPGELPPVAEYDPAFGAYVRKASHVSDVISALPEQVAEFTGLLAGLSPEQQRHRYAEGKWSVKEVLGHITDTERIFAYRALRIGRGDETALPGFEENSYVAAADAGRLDWDEMLEELRLVRKTTVLLFQHFPANAWPRIGTSNNAALSVRALAYIILGHVYHHSDVLRERYLIGPE